MASHLRNLLDLSAAEFAQVIELAHVTKRDPGLSEGVLAGKSVALIFAKSSTRTRVSFEVGLWQLGAQPLVLASSAGPGGMQMGRGETVADTARVMSRYVDAINIRTYAQSDVDGLAEHGSVPVVNMLTDDWHPCQVLADVMTIEERFGSAKGLKMVYVGAANNVSNSLMLAGTRAGFDVVVACPESLSPEPEVMTLVEAEAARAGVSMSVSHDLQDAVKDAQVIYTDTWVSMGQSDEADALRKTLSGFTVDEALMAQAHPDAIFMHCLPAHRGEEVTDGVMDGAQSVVFDEAENRLHSQKALMLLLMGAVPWS